MIKISSESTNEIILIKQIVQLALEKKARQVVSLDLRGLSSVTDHYIICSGDSEPQVKAIADNIRDKMSEQLFHQEGYGKLKWVLLDYVNLIVHIFRLEERSYYNLEKLWADAPLTEYFDDNIKKENI